MIAIAVLSAAAWFAAQQPAPPTAFPLESVTVEGSAIPQAVVLELSGLRVGALIEKGAIDAACATLNATGLFQSINYRYAPGPQKGYAVTLTLEDQSPLEAASIDIPGVESEPAWQWLVGRFRRFDHRVPPLEAGQRFLARQLEQHLAASLRGQPLTVRMETDLATGKMLLSFQPEVLPRVAAVSFRGNQAVSSGALAEVLNKLVVNENYTPRGFASRVDLNLRPLYEERGFYRVRFAPGEPRFNAASVDLEVAIAEGEACRLGKVEIAGEDVPAEAMLRAAKFSPGKLANWTEIQKGIWEMERVVKQTGYFAARIVPARTFDDADHRLDLRLQVNKGPLYHFGTLSLTGLRPDIEARARELWKRKPGDPFDYQYSTEFLQNLTRTVGALPYKIGEETEEQPGHVMNVRLTFEPRAR